MQKTNRTNRTTKTKNIENYRKQSKKERKQINDFFFRRPNASGCIRMHPDASQRVPMGPNGSEYVGNFEELAETSNKSGKIDEIS